MNSEYTDYEDDYIYIYDDLKRKERILDILRKPFNDDLDEEITNEEDGW